MLKPKLEFGSAGFSGGRKSRVLVEKTNNKVHPYEKDDFSNSATTHCLEIDNLTSE